MILIPGQAAGADSQGRGRVNTGRGGQDRTALRRDLRVSGWLAWPSAADADGLLGEERPLRPRPQPMGTTISRLTPRLDPPNSSIPSILTPHRWDVLPSLRLASPTDSCWAALDSSGGP